MTPDVQWLPLARGHHIGQYKSITMSSCAGQTGLGGGTQDLWLDVSPGWRVCLCDLLQSPATSLMSVEVSPDPCDNKALPQPCFP